MNTTTETDPTRWYRLPIMWLVVFLPLVSFVGGTLLVAFTFLNPDPEVHSERITAPPAAHTPGG